LWNPEKRSKAGFREEISRKALTADTIRAAVPKPNLLIPANKVEEGECTLTWRRG